MNARPSTFALPLEAGPVLSIRATPVHHGLLVVATDWDRDLRAAGFAVRRAAGGDIHVDVLYAIARVDHWPSRRIWSDERIRDWQRVRGERLLEQTYDHLREHGITAACHFRIDEPDQAVTQLARELKPEAVVLPTPPPLEIPPFGYWWDMLRIVRHAGVPIVLA